MYKEQGKKVLLMKPKLDTRFGAESIKSRAGLEQPADILLTSDTNLREMSYSEIDCILVDEVQFLPAAQIDDLRYIVTFLKTPVICYGLRSDFRSQLFDGSRRLFEVADEIEEIKATCRYCTHKSIMNLRIIDGVPSLSGPTILLGADETYQPVCYLCYQLKIATVEPST
jgi:thymidine kinase